jgi:hypothetical protein
MNNDLKISSGGKEIIASGVVIPYKGSDSIKMKLLGLEFEFIIMDDTLRKDANGMLQRGLIDFELIKNQDRDVGAKIKLINFHSDLGSCTTQPLSLWSFPEGKTLSVNFAVKNIKRTHWQFEYSWYLG